MTADERLKAARDSALAAFPLLVRPAVGKRLDELIEAVLEKAREDARRDRGAGA